MAYLPKAQQALWRGQLQQTYVQPTYTEAKASLEELRGELKRVNEFAVRSLDEGLEETLTLDRLGVGPTLHRSLATTNGLESIFALVEQRTGKVVAGRIATRSSAGSPRRSWTSSRACAVSEGTAASHSCGRLFRRRDKEQRSQRRVLPDARGHMKCN